MFFSYNHVPFKEEYCKEHGIFDDLSNSFKCYNYNEQLFNDIDGQNILTMTPDEFVSDVEGDDKNVLLDLLDNRPVRYLYNVMQDKYQVYLCFSREEKTRLSQNINNEIWCTKYYKYIDGPYTEYFIETDFYPEYKEIGELGKYWIWCLNENI